MNEESLDKFLNLLYENQNAIRTYEIQQEIKKKRAEHNERGLQGGSANVQLIEIVVEGMVRFVADFMGELANNAQFVSDNHISKFWASVIEKLNQNLPSTVKGWSSVISSKGQDKQAVEAGLSKAIEELEKVYIRIANLEEEKRFFLSSLKNE